MFEMLEYNQYKLNVVIQGDQYPCMHSTVVLIRIGKRRILVDTGYVMDRALLIENLSSIGETPHSITDLVLTHFHMDHIANVDLFDMAQIYMGKEDYETICSIYLKLGDDEALSKIIQSVSNLRIVKKIKALKTIFVNNGFLLAHFMEIRNKIMLIDKESFELDEFISIVKSPGHSDGHLAVCCRFDRNICIAGDAIAVSSLVYGKEASEIGLINQDSEQFDITKRILLDWSDLVYPGHDRPIIISKR